MKSVVTCRMYSDNENDCDNEITHWKLNAINAVSNLIGRPSRVHIKETKKNSIKRVIEENRYKNHKQLFNKLVNYTMEGAEEANYDPSLMNIEDHINSWRNIFSKRLHGNITPKTASVKIIGLNNVVDRIIKKRDKTLKKATKRGELPKSDLFYAPPDYISSWIDKFGFMDKIIQKIMKLQDDNITESGKFLNRITESRKRLKEILTTQLRNDENSFGFNTDSLMDGISNFIMATGERIIITESVVKEGQGRGYNYYVDGDIDKKMHFIEANQVGDDVNDKLIEKYIDTFVDELGNGQIRKIIPKLSQNIDKDDFKKINKKLNQLKNAKGSDRVPGIHTRIVGEFQYRYVMIKQGEGGVDEKYNAYLLDKAKLGLDGKRQEGVSPVYFMGKSQVVEGGKVIEKQIMYDQNELDKVLKEGFYKSDDYNDFGKLRIINKKTNKEEPQFKDFGHSKRFINFKFMENQPNKDVMPLIFKNLAEIRDVYKSAFAEIKAKNDKQEIKRNKLKENVIAYRTKAHGETPEQALQWLDKFYEANNINNNIYTDENGEIRTSTSFAAKKKENYFPHRYKKMTMYKDMLPSAIKEIKRKIRSEGVETEENKERLDRLSTGLEHLEEMLNNYLSNKPFSITPQQAKIVKNLKHITSWTNPLLRRKDGNLHSAYFNESFDALHRQSIMNDLAEIAYKTDRIGKGSIPPGSLDFIVNRIKIAFGDPSSRAISLGLTGFKETSFEKMAQKLNSLPNLIRGGNTFNGKDAERITKWLTAIPSSLFLGGSSAMQNSGQIVNTMIEVGWTNIREASQAMKNNSDKWKEITQNTGALNVLSMFQDIMMADGDPKFFDAGFHGVGGFQIPTLRTAELIKMLRAGRKSFINNPNKSIDGLLLKMIHSQDGTTREKLLDLLTISKLKKGITTSRLNKKKGQLYDMFTAKEGTDEKVLKKLFKDLLGDESDSVIKRMVSWKLSWWFPSAGEPGKDFFTFTGSEERLRTLTVVSALLHAQKQGLISGDDLNADKELFMTPNAVKIARNAVYQTQFGMTLPHIGEGFNGFGRALWQYKQYPTMQMAHDYQVLQKFLDSNDGTTGNVNRLVKATFTTINNTIKSKKYDPKNRFNDDEAIAMVRFISTRIVASTIASVVSIVPYIRPIFNMGGLNTFGMLRGAENPAVAIALRTMLWFTLFGMGAEEEDERNELTKSFGFLLFPVALGMFFNMAKSMYEFSDEF